MSGSTWYPGTLHPCPRTIWSLGSPSAPQVGREGLQWHCSQGVHTVLVGGRGVPYHWVLSKCRRVTTIVHIMLWILFILVTQRRIDKGVEIYRKYFSKVCWSFLLTLILIPLWKSMIPTSDPGSKNRGFCWCVCPSYTCFLCIFFTAQHDQFK